jgi:hypothetical protein
MFTRKSLTRLAMFSFVGALALATIQERAFARNHPANGPEYTSGADVIRNAERRAYRNWLRPTVRRHLWSRGNPWSNVYRKQVHKRTFRSPIPRSRNYLGRSRYSGRRR